MNMRRCFGPRFFTLQATVALFTLGLASCGSDTSVADDTSSGAAGSGSGSTAGASGASGASGSAGAAGGGNGGSGATGGTAGVGSGGAGSDGGGAGGGASGSGGTALSTYLGRACESDNDCDGLHCVTQDGDEWYGSPVGGYCTLECDGGGVAACEAAGGKCIPGYVAHPSVTEPCLLTCPDEREPLSGEFDPALCHGRQELACTTAGACRPQCHSDAECGSRSCSLDTGLCMDEPPTGLPIGSECVEQIPDDCDGWCIKGICTADCTWGTARRPGGCGSEPSGPQDAACVSRLVGGWETTSWGDIGLCAQLCDCASDCRHPDLKCRQMDEYPDVFGREGVCAPDTGEHDLTNCP